MSMPPADLLPWSHRYTVEYEKYDWSINSQARAQTSVRLPIRLTKKMIVCCVLAKLYEYLTTPENQQFIVHAAPALAAPALAGVRSIPKQHRRAPSTGGWEAPSKDTVRMKNARNQQKGFVEVII